MKIADIVFIGSGIACTSTLTDIFRKLMDGAPSGKKLSITVIEKNQELWLGIPYGTRSSVNALTITSVHDFFTAENERALFFAWFKVHKDELLEYYLLTGGLSAKLWMERNAAALQKEEYHKVYLPRFMCGRYIQSKFNNLLKIVKEKQLIRLRLINAEATDIQPGGGLYELTLEMPGNSLQIIKAKKVVLATGSAPPMDIVNGVEGVCIINNIYEPGVDANLRNISRVLTAVKDAESRNVLLVGSNASSIEFLYVMAGLPELTAAINKLVVISRSGLYPYHIIQKTLDSYHCENLDKLKADGSYNINTLVAAAMEDVKIAVKEGVIVPYIDRVIGYTFELLQALDEDAKKQFIGIYGMQLSNQFRRSGADYKGGEALLLEIQKIIMLKGAFIGIEHSDKGGLLSYANPDTHIRKTYGTPFKVVINCTGANDLDRSGSRLIYNLVHKKIAGVNLSGKGFYVNEHFEAAPNLYVIGPLLGGNTNARIHFWHLENASRIMYLSSFLADCLVDE